MTVLPESTIGRLEYNGFRFPPAVHARVRATPVSDSTGRVTKWIKYTLEIECMLFPGADSQVLDPPIGGVVTPADGIGGRPLSLFPDTLISADGDTSPTVVDGMDRLRKVLTEQGKALYFQTKGFGHDFLINVTDSNVADVAYGPRPTLLAWEPIAANKAVRIVWGVEVSISECVPLKLPDGRITEFTYSVDYALDDHGFTTRTVSGFLELSQRLQADGTGRFAIDEYRNYIQVELPLTFKRKSQNFGLSPDQRRLTFRIVDEEIPSEGPYHNGMVKEDVTHTIQSAGGPVIGSRWMIAIRGSFSVAPGFNKGLAWRTFLLYVKSRREAALKHSTISSGDNRRASGDKKYPHAFPVRLTIVDHVTGRGFTAEMAWLIFTTYKTVLKAAGLFEGLDSQHSWLTYRESMLKGRGKQPWSVRGAAELRHPPSKQIVSLCSTAAPAAIEDKQSVFSAPDTYQFFTSPCPKIDESYVAFDQYGQVTTDNATEYLTPTGNAQKWDFDREMKPGSANTGTGYVITQPSAGNVRDYVKIHQRSAPTWTVRIFGSAKRWGYPVEMPTLKEYGGAKVKHPIGKSVFTEHESKWVEGCKMYSASWEQEYVLESQPEGNLIITDPSFEGFPD